ncbi:hypothetical protein BKA57DRAFT_489522, partial [Linnemannia elongata]
GSDSLPLCFSALFFSFFFLGSFRCSPSPLSLHQVHCPLSLHQQSPLFININPFITFYIHQIPFLGNSTFEQTYSRVQEGLSPYHLPSSPQTLNLQTQTITDRTWLFKS